MKLWKLTDENDRTYGGCQWGENVTHETCGEGELCGPGFTHWYTSPLLAVFLNPIHGNFDLATAHLWEGEGEIVKDDHGLKVGCTRATTILRVPMPKVTTDQRIRFALLCAMEVYHDSSFTRWARRWLDGTDRTAAAAADAADAAAAADAADAAAALAADAAAARAAEAAAARAARAAARAARAAEDAAARAGSRLDLAAMAERAMKEGDA